MRPIKVTFRPEARTDLSGLFDYLSAEAGARIAEGYVERLIEAMHVPRAVSKAGSAA